jgi:uncharacterized repeat protein (TIGR01451 family)
MNCPKPQARVVQPVKEEVRHVEVRGGPARIELTPETDVNPVKTQHIFVATVRDASGNPLPGVDVEWILSRSGAASVGDIVDVDGGRKVDNTYAKSVTGSSSYTITRGNNDAGDDVQVGPGQTWCVITATEEGQSKMVAYAPQIDNWDTHKAFAVKNWSDMNWQAPVDATNRVGTQHVFTFRVFRASDQTPLSGVNVSWTITGGPPANLNGSGNTASTKTDASGVASVTLTQQAPTPGTNEIQFTAVRPAMKDECRCYPETILGTWTVRKHWIAPSIAIAKTGPARETVGHSFQYDIVVTNTSPDLDVRDVVVTDPIPGDLVYESSNPPAEASGNNLTWRLGTMAQGSSRTLTVNVHATHSGNVENCATVTAEGGLTARACAPTTFSAPALTIRKTGPAEASVCDPITYTITVTNTGDGEAQNVHVTDQMPAGVTTNDQTDWMVGTLAPHDTRSFTITGRANQAGTVVNRATATAEGVAPVSDQVSTNIMKCELQIRKTAPAERKFGRPLPYDIVVTNVGNTDAKGVIVEDTLPAGVTFQNASDGGMCTGATVVWNLGTIAKGQSKGISLNTVVTANQEGTVHNTVTARGDCCDTVTASADTRISGVAAILLETIDVDDPIELNGTETYVIDVTNQGNAPDRNVVIQCTLPAEEDFISAEGPDGTQFQASGKVVKFNPYPSLAPKQVIRYRVVVKATAVGDVRFATKLTSDMLQGGSVDETESTHIY